MIESILDKNFESMIDLRHTGSTPPKTTEYAFDEASPALIDRVQRYWTKRAPSYTEDVIKKMTASFENAWLEIIKKHLPQCDHTPTVLDVGTGPGFFPMLFAGSGWKIMAVDYTPAMLEEARMNTFGQNDDLTFHHMDAHDLRFDDASFDIVISRNLTWNLERPYEAYREWMRVLRRGGVLINFDANWYAHLFDEESRHGYEADRTNAAEYELFDHYIHTDVTEMESIAQNLPLGRFNRPTWDMAALLDIGCSSVTVDCDFWKKVWSYEEQVNYASTPGFMICATK